MPTYQYACESCSSRPLLTHSFEALADIHVCDCGFKLQRVWTAPDFHNPTDLNPLERQAFMEHKKYIEDGVRNEEFELRGRNTRGSEFEPDVNRMRPVKKGKN